jgi:hypothetical protein
MYFRYNERNSEYTHAGIKAFPGRIVGKRIDMIYIIMLVCLSSLKN